MNQKDEDIAHPGMVSKPEKTSNFAQFSNSPWSWEHATSVLGGATVCFMRICDYKFAVYGFFAEDSRQQFQVMPCQYS